MSRRGTTLAAFIAACALLAISGCTDVSRGSFESAQLAWRSRQKLKVTAEEVAAKPYYQLHVTTKDGDAILILGNVDGRRVLWYGRDGIVVVLQDGRVEQTIGLPQNLDGSHVLGTDDPFQAGLQTLKSPLTYEREDDWSPDYRYGVPVHAELSPAGSTDIDILGTRHHVLLVNEIVSAKAAGYHATNRYWVDPTDGFVWMSEQQVMPGLTMKLVQLRPYREAKP